MVTLEINNVVVDLSENAIALTKKAYPDSDWLIRDIMFSERLRLPQTSELDKLFYRLYDLGIETNKFGKYYDFKYKDGSTIIFAGKAKLLGFNSNREYELQLLDSNVGLFANMEDSIKRIDFESSDFVFNLTAYSNLKTLNSSVWIWAAANMHESRELVKNVLSGETAFSRPFFSIKRLLEGCFGANSWQYELSNNSLQFMHLIELVHYKKIFMLATKNMAPAQNN